MEETRQRGAAPEARREWKGPQLLSFFKNSIIWERVVINFQNTLQSPTFHTAPSLSPLVFADKIYEPSESQKY